MADTYFVFLQKIASNSFLYLSRKASGPSHHSLSESSYNFSAISDCMKSRRTSSVDFPVSSAISSTIIIVTRFIAKTVLSLSICHPIFDSFAFEICQARNGLAASEAESSGSSPGAAISVTPSRGVSVGFSYGSWGAVSSGSSVEEVPAGSSWVFSDDVSSVFSDGASENPAAGSSSEGSGSVLSFTASVKAVSSIYCSSCS